MVSKSKILAFVIVTLALMQGSAAIGEAITVLTLNNVPDTQSKTFKVTTVWLGGTAACDVLIACTMIYFLLKDRSKYRSADSVVTKIIRIALQTGLFTAVVAIIELCLFLIFKHNFYHLLPALMLSKLYSNSLLSLLNSRLTVDYRRGTEFHTSTATKRLKDEEASRTQGHTMSVGEDVQNNIAMVTFNSADVWLGGTALCDVLIASLMVYYLSRGRTGFKKTDSMINNLIRMTLETGLSILSIFELCMFTIFQHNFFHLVPAFMLSKLYSNSLLVLLNNRLTIGLRERPELPTRQRTSVIAGGTFGVHPGGDTIQISIEQETYNDDASTVKIRGPKEHDDESCSKIPTGGLVVE
ncbi:hypothetical protein CERSUDRAFT_95652 [Gelatoporia subvermispora B]|uniref:DUF6534 domain-containing protein n=1 Tax=Ceriporiopsis subvermispora (strain B) TaxID=914234 RepID=M2QGZ9_CERS8|nr:hypothetical protein CERSUDRAFT_95652 [Gelatoporia subvermispora B]